MPRVIDNRQAPFSDRSLPAQAMRRMLDAAWPEVRDAPLLVHPDDDMYAFGVAEIGELPLSAMAYFRAGASMLDVITAIADWHFGGPERIGSFLDFAAGYGRSTRFLAELLGPERVTVAEIQSDALAFQAREFKVRTLHSTSDPAELRAPQRYSFVFVASLFSHLPRATFTTWLARLWSLVEDGGVLAFSVHDEVLDEHGAPWQDGYAFLPASEVAELDTAEYGTAFTTEQFVREQLRATVGAASDDARRLPRALCFTQDVWVVRKGTTDPAPLQYECGPRGALEHCEVSGRLVTLQGWAADAGTLVPGAGTHPIARVELRFSDGTTVPAHHGRSFHPLAELFKRVGDPNYENSGWDAQVRLRRRARPGDTVTVLATCDQGRSAPLDSVRLDDASLRYGGAPMALSAMDRRLRTARLVYQQDGPAGLLRLAPTIARNERRRLAASVRALRSRRASRRPTI